MLRVPGDPGPRQGNGVPRFRLDAGPEVSIRTLPPATSRQGFVQRESRFNLRVLFAHTFFSSVSIFNKHCVPNL